MTDRNPTWWILMLGSIFCGFVALHYTNEIHRVNAVSFAWCWFLVYGIVLGAMSIVYLVIQMDRK